MAGRAMKARRGGGARKRGVTLPRAYRDLILQLQNARRRGPRLKLRRRVQNNQKNRKRWVTHPMSSIVYTYTTRANPVPGVPTSMISDPGSIVYVAGQTGAMLRILIGPRMFGPWAEYDSEVYSRLRLGAAIKFTLQTNIHMTVPGQWCMYIDPSISDLTEDLDPQASRTHTTAEWDALYLDASGQQGAICGDISADLHIADVDSYARMADVRNDDAITAGETTLVIPPDCYRNDGLMHALYIVVHGLNPTLMGSISTLGTVSAVTLHQLDGRHPPKTAA